jgi:hypothetical protein
VHNTSKTPERSSTLRTIARQLRHCRAQFCEPHLSLPAGLHIADTRPARFHFARPDYDDPPRADLIRTAQLVTEAAILVLEDRGETGRPQLLRGPQRLRPGLRT